MNNEDKKIEVMPIGKVTLRDGTEMTINSRQIENYATNKKNRPKGKKVSKNTSKKTSLSKGKVAAAMIAVSALALVGQAAYVGRENIINNINNSNFVSKNVYTIKSENNGYRMFEVDINGKNNEINSNDYIVELCTTGQENGYTKEEIAIYCKEAYDTDYGLSEGIISEIETELESYMQFINGNNKVEGRQK